MAEPRKDIKRTRAVDGSKWEPVMRQVAPDTSPDRFIEELLVRTDRSQYLGRELRRVGSTLRSAHLRRTFDIRTDLGI